MLVWAVLAASVSLQRGQKQNFKLSEKRLCHNPLGEPFHPNIPSILVKELTFLLSILIRADR
jgi:hypothetical protein